MVSRRTNDDETSRPRRPPAATAEQREQQLVAAAVELAEKQLREGTASAQVITHYLKLGSTREQLEQERIRGENKLLIAKVEQLASAARSEELFSAAIAAMRGYTGADDVGELD